MSDTQFTPGPWVVSKHSVRISVTAANFEHRGNRGGGALVAFSPIRFDSTQAERGLANAHLIAAAPDLYEALAWFINDIDGTHTVMVDFDANVEKARTALARARGQS